MIAIKQLFFAILIYGHPNLTVTVYLGINVIIIVFSKLYNILAVPEEYFIDGREQSMLQK